MTKSRIDLIYFEGCPNAFQARENIRAATLQALGTPGEWAEWDLMDDSTPEEFRRYGSPTVLVDGHDVTGGVEEVTGGVKDVTGGVEDVRAMACRADGAPSVELIAAKLA
ncbi:MAG TPA: hypothetical protein VK837_06955 [Longimicrobiales bacterium]|nr:hypothetical protein [Longimicrobiales bacterium]